MIVGKADKTVLILRERSRRYAANNSPKRFSDHRLFPFRLGLGGCVSGNRDSEIGHGEIGEGPVVELGRKGGICKSRNSCAATVAMMKTLSVIRA